MWCRRQVLRHASIGRLCSRRYVVQASHRASGTSYTTIESSTLHYAAWLRDDGSTRLRDCGTLKTQAFSGVLSLSQPFSAVRYRAWLIREFREIKEFRDVRAMPATNQVSDVLPLNRAARSLTSLNSLISLNSLLTARYRHAQQRDEFLSEGVRCGAIPKDGWMGVYLGVHPHSGR